MHFEFSPLILWIVLWIVNTYSEFQVNIFTNKRDITKCHSFCMTTTMTTPKATAIPRVFYENSQAKNVTKSFYSETIWICDNIYLEFTELSDSSVFCLCCGLDLSSDLELCDLLL